MPPLRNFIFILLCLLGPCVISAHELCADFSGPKQFPGQLSVCTEYNNAPDSGLTCCQPSDEDYIHNTVWNIGISTPLSDCPDMLRKLFCTRCDPWEAHLFGTEFDPNSNRKFAIMCNDWCGYFYHACANEYMHWNDTPSGVNLFGGKSNYLRDDWPTVDAFCSAFGMPASAPPRENCFAGSPYVPNPPPKAPADAQPICLEYWAPSTWQPLVSAIADPNDGTDRLFVAYHNGKIGVFKRSTGDYIGSFLTLPGVMEDGEAGFTALAFHPNFSTNGRFFVHYSSWATWPGNPIPCTGDGYLCGSGLYPSCVNGTCAADHISVISEFRVSATNPNVADPTEKHVLTLAQPFRIHNLGAMLFGPDGMLYIAWGDGGNFNDPNGRGQSLETLLGKVIRIDVDSAPDQGKGYHVPQDNPFFNTPGVWPEIYAYGFRNPWSCSFDGNRLICGDVGQDLVEEINIVKPATDYGWRMWEGHVPTAINPANTTTGFTFSAVEYTHDFIGGNCAIIAGHVYRGKRYPELVGTYLAADHSGILWTMPQKNGNPDSFDLKFLRPLCAVDSASCSTNLGNIFTIGQDSNGDLYYSTSNGILRVVEMARCNGSTETPVTTAPQTTAPAPTTAAPTTKPATTAPPTSAPATQSPTPAVTTPSTTKPVLSTTGRVGNSSSAAGCTAAISLLVLLVGAVLL